MVGTSSVCGNRKEEKGYRPCKDHQQEEEKEKENIHEKKTYHVNDGAMGIPTARWVKVGWAVVRRTWAEPLH